MKILVTGATGQFGKTVVETLLANGWSGQLAVSVRNPARASAYEARGVEVRQGDFNQPETLGAAFAGVDRALIISTGDDDDSRIRQHAAAVQAAQAAGVQLIAYTSIANATNNPLSLARVHRATEQAIRETGIPFVFLRNNWYLENEFGSIQGALAGAPIRTAAGNGKVGWALRAEYARAAAAVLSGSGHENKTYELGGPLSSYADLAAALGQVIGKPVQVEQVNDEGYGQHLTNVGLPDFLVPLFVQMTAKIREGALAVESNDLEKLLGRPVTPLRDALAGLVKQAQPA